MRQGLGSFPNCMFAVIPATVMDLEGTNVLSARMEFEQLYTRVKVISHQQGTAPEVPYLVHFPRPVLSPFLTTVLLIVRLSALRNPHHPNCPNLVSTPFRLPPLPFLVPETRFLLLLQQPEFIDGRPDLRIAAPQSCWFERFNCRCPLPLFNRPRGNSARRPTITDQGLSSLLHPA
jgi:hypothetical protein